MAIAETYDLEGALRRFDLTSFRRGQREVISSVLNGRECLCIMPTGGGKSLCYQMPAIMRDGVTLVVSPLIALMKDQVDAMHRHQIRATLINSSLGMEEQFDRVRGISEGRYDLVYVAPERFRSRRFVEALGQTKVDLLAVDEAHCISQWGHDFRPDYSRLGQFREQIGSPQTIALTATATPRVREDVIRLLGLDEPAVFVTGFARENLRYEVLKCRSRGDKEDTLLKFIQETPGTGIIYVSSREKCQTVAEMLNRRTTRRVGVYHAGLSSDDRRRAQDEFMDGSKDIVVATVAFGMGVNKVDVRFVVHYNMPGSLEAYYQEAGRAGRDGKTSRCLMLYSAGDSHIQEFFIENSFPKRANAAKVYDYLRHIEEEPIELTLEQLKDRLDMELGSEGIGACLQILDRCGALERLEPRQNMAIIKLNTDVPTMVDLLPSQAKSQRRVLQTLERIVGERRHQQVYFQPPAVANSLEMDLASVQRALRQLCTLADFDYIPPFRGRAVHILNRNKLFSDLEIDFSELEQRKQAEYEKLHKITEFAKGRGCRERDILLYFGESGAAVCGRCDNCQLPSGSDEGIVVTPTAESPVALAIQKVLSGVARIQQQFEKRQLGFGKQVVAQMLCGSKSKQILRWKLDRLTTFGLLDYLKISEATSLIDLLITGGLLMTSSIGRFRFIVRLTDLGAEVMRGRETLESPLSLPASLLAKISQHEQPSDASSNPVVLEVSGDQRTCGSPAWEEQEPAISEEATRPSASVSVSVDTNLQKIENDKPPLRPGYYWTWKLLSRGFQVSECALIRRVSEEEIWDHAIRAMESGLAVEPGWLLSSSELAVLRDELPVATTDESTVQLRPILDRLPEGFTRQHVQVFLKCQRLKP